MRVTPLTATVCQNWLVRYNSSGTVVVLVANHPGRRCVHMEVVNGNQACPATVCAAFILRGVCTYVRQGAPTWCNDFAGCPVTPVKSQRCGA